MIEFDETVSDPEATCQFPIEIEEVHRSLAYTGRLLLRDGDIVIFKMIMPFVFKRHNDVMNWDALAMENCHAKTEDRQPDFNVAIEEEPCSST